MKKILLISFLTCSMSIFGQQEDAWIFLKDKPNESFFLNNPLKMLSQRAIDRRIAQQVMLNNVDVPIDSLYFATLKSIKNVSILGKSKWLNAVHVKAPKKTIDSIFTSLSFIHKIEFADKSLNNLSNKSTRTGYYKKHNNHKNKLNSFTTVFNYGAANTQIKMLNGHFLHNKGFTGKGQIIAILDAGFPEVNTLPAFQRIRENNQILGGYNFADRNTNIYSRNNHGTHVLSTIAGYLKDRFLGTAPDAEFYLFITEIEESETVLEETLWVEAAEKADSLGVDVINTSLGYSTFDNFKHNYSYADMDGKTTFISRGANIAASRGILVVNSAGNSGNDSWKYITAPADAENVISVGAINKDSIIASFSSFGPTVDGRVKPEILALGVNSAVVNATNGNISLANGTSFSSPIMAGLIACLNGKEVVYTKTSNAINAPIKNYFLKKSLIESADKFLNPTAQYGFGIPNFETAYLNYTDSTNSINESTLASIKVVPNPIEKKFSIVGFTNTNSTFDIKVYTILGKLVYQKSASSTGEIHKLNVSRGFYFLSIKQGKLEKILKIIVK